MTMKSVTERDFTNQRVLVRTDFNVELNNLAEVQEHFKLEVSRKTIDYLLQFPGVKVAMVTHFGRPKNKEAEYSVRRLVSSVEQVLEREVVFVEDCIGETVVQALEALPEGALILMENVRYYPGEEANDPTFAEALTKPFDVYVNEAFSASHRAHASIAGVTRYLPSYAGFRLMEEVTKLDQVRFSPEHPAIAVIGGAKIETKLSLIRAFEQSYDCILVGGMVANEAIDEAINFSEKVLLPIDFDSDQRLDIGPNTVAYFTQIIKTAKTIVWNGPLGKFEEKPYDIGTAAILHAILESKAFVVIGGGESLAILEHAGVIDKIGFVSSGGGAMLEYLGGIELPGLKALQG